MVHCVYNEIERKLNYSTYLADCTAIYHVGLSLNKSVFTRGHSLSEVTDCTHFQTLRSNFRGIYIKNFFLVF